jgi:hypothetical protein
MYMCIYVYVYTHTKNLNFFQNFKFSHNFQNYHVLTKMSHSILRNRERERERERVCVCVFVCACVCVCVCVCAWCVLKMSHYSLRNRVPSVPNSPNFQTKKISRLDEDGPTALPGPQSPVCVYECVCVCTRVCVCVCVCVTM